MVSNDQKGKQMSKKAKDDSCQMTFSTSDLDEEKMREFFSPAQVDLTVRQAIQMCWMMLPKKKRNPKNVEKEVRRQMDRAIRDFKKDFDTFKSG
jgi:hypothetical protein